MPRTSARRRTSARADACGRYRSDCAAASTRLRVESGILPQPLPFRTMEAVVFETSAATATSASVGRFVIGIVPYFARGNKVNRFTSAMKDNRTPVVCLQGASRTEKEFRVTL